MMLVIFVGEDWEKEREVEDASSMASIKRCMSGSEEFIYAGVF